MIVLTLQMNVCSLETYLYLAFSIFSNQKRGMINYSNLSIFDSWKGGIVCLQEMVPDCWHVINGMNSCTVSLLKID